MNCISPCQLLPPVLLTFLAMLEKSSWATGSLRICPPLNSKSNLRSRLGSRGLSLCPAKRTQEVKFCIITVVKCHRPQWNNFEFKCILVQQSWSVTSSSKNWLVNPIPLPKQNTLGWCSSWFCFGNEKIEHFPITMEICSKIQLKTTKMSKTQMTELRNLYRIFQLNDTICNPLLELCKYDK